MKRILLILFLVGGSTSTALGSGFDADVYLTQDKTMVGLGLSVIDSKVGLDLDLAFIYLNDESERIGFPADDSFVGNLLGIHLIYRVHKVGPAEGRVGVGFDYWALWGINGDEYKMGLPLFVEARYALAPGITTHLQARSYLIASDGLGLGVDFDGEETSPVLMTVGLGGTFQ